MLSSRRAALLLASVVSLIATLLPAAVSTAAVSTTAAPLRLLTVGDSVTQGSAGDWTWRYRMWKHLAGTERGVDLVGPRNDLYDAATAEHGSQAYVDPSFDRDHAARWGMSFAFSDWNLEHLVSTHRPDVVVELLGVNDLTFLGAEADYVVARARDLVAEARTADPAVDVVLGGIPQTWYAKVNDANVGLQALAAELDDDVARVVYADTARGFKREAHTWDGSHPNAQGELLLAAAVVDALSELNVAPPFPRPLADLPLGPRLPAGVTARAGDGALTVSWTGSPGADEHRLWVRDLSGGGPRRLVEARLAATGTRTLGGLVNGHTYETWVQPVKGWWAAAEDVRAPVRARPMPPRPFMVASPTVRSPSRDVIVATAPRAARADSYSLQVAPARSCQQAGLQYRTVKSGLSAPRATHRTTTGLVRVRFIARNLAGSGPAGRSTCARVR